MFTSPFPEFISFFCENLSSSHDFFLHPDEEKISDSFGSSKRRDEFSLGRYCARKALSKFEMESVPILRNTESREPLWPKTVRGSITHTEGFAAAAVGMTKDVSGIGIDLESLSKVVDFNIRRHVCVEKEQKFLESLNDEQANQYLRIIFSAKESIFKCFFPISKTHLTFKDAEIIIDEKNSEFSFLLTKACAGITSAGFQHSGRFSINNDLLLTSIYI